MQFKSCHSLIIWTALIGKFAQFFSDSSNSRRKACPSFGECIWVYLAWFHFRLIDEKALGANHHEVATDLNNLAALYYRQKKYTEAEPLIKRSLAIDEKTLDANHGPR
jgi:tetratricopeptide (TPR) repeat protein